MVQVSRWWWGLVDLLLYAMVRAYNLTRLPVDHKLSNKSKHHSQNRGLLVGACPAPAGVSNEYLLLAHLLLSPTTYLGFCVTSCEQSDI